MLTTACAFTAEASGPSPSPWEQFVLSQRRLVPLAQALRTVCAFTEEAGAPSPSPWEQFVHSQRRLIVLRLLFCVSP